MKPGAVNSVQISHMGDKNTVTSAIIAASQGSPSQEPESCLILLKSFLSICYLPPTLQIQTSWMYLFSKTWNLRPTTPCTALKWFFVAYCALRFELKISLPMMSGFGVFQRLTEAMAATGASSLMFYSTNTWTKVTNSICICVFRNRY